MLMMGLTAQSVKVCWDLQLVAIQWKISKKSSLEELLVNINDDDDDDDGGDDGGDDGEGAASTKAQLENPSNSPKGSLKS